MSNACLFLSGKQNDTTRQLLHRCAASLNEQHTAYLIACSSPFPDPQYWESLIPRSSVLGESHSQTISTGRVSFPDYQYWGSLFPRLSVLGESHSQTLSAGGVSFPDPQYWGSLIPRLSVLGESHSQTPSTGGVSFPDPTTGRVSLPDSVRYTLGVEGLGMRLSSSHYIEHACCFSSRLAFSLVTRLSGTRTRMQTRAWEWGYIALSLSTVTDKHKGWQGQAILMAHHHKRLQF